MDFMWKEEPLNFDLLNMRICPIKWSVVVTLPHVFESYIMLHIKHLDCINNHGHFS